MDKQSIYSGCRIYLCLFLTAVYLYVINEDVSVCIGDSYRIRSCFVHIVGLTKYLWAVGRKGNE